VSPLRRGLTAAGGLTLAAYFAWLVSHAIGELADEAPIAGLRRTYTPPYALPTGDAWVIDPRPGELAAELTARFGAAPTAPAPGPAAAAADWAAWLIAAGHDPPPRPPPPPPSPPTPPGTTCPAWCSSPLAPAWWWDASSING
jgi:hypothetical protein